jgi:hypothetical protein
MSGQRRLIERLRERRQRKRERTGDSPEKRSERHVPKGDVVDVMLKSGGVDRPNRFKG